MRACHCWSSNFIGADAAKALSEARRVTRPGGAVAAAVWEYGDGMRMLRIFGMRRRPWIRRSEKLEKSTCRSAGRRAFRIVETGRARSRAEQPLDITMKFASFQDYWDPFLLGQGPGGSVCEASLDPTKWRSFATRRSAAEADGESIPFTLPARVRAVPVWSEER